MRILQGIDIVSVRRMRQAVESGGESFIKKVFTAGERAYCEPRKMKYEHFAARFAAKEALVKAVKTRKPFPLHSMK